MESGDLRHRVDIQYVATQVQDPDTGALTPVWRDKFTDLAAAIEYLSGREYVASAAVQHEIVARVTVRQRPEGVNVLEPKQRIVHGVKCCKHRGREVFNPAAMLPDNDSGWQFVTIPCSRNMDDA